MPKEEKQGYQPICKGNQNRVTPPNTGSHVKMEELEELLNSTLEENKEIYKKMTELDTALEDCTESLTDARIKIKGLEKGISVLLSCKNCPENKGGYICQKEYEDKCLSQKIQYIKGLKEEIAELEKENAELKEEIKKWRDEWQEQVQKANDEGYARTLQTIQLNKAKKIIGNLYAICKDNHYPNTSVLMEQAEQFLKESE